MTTFIFHLHVPYSGEMNIHLLQIEAQNSHIFCASTIYIEDMKQLIVFFFAFKFSVSGFLFEILTNISYI